MSPRSPPSPPLSAISSLSSPLSSHSDSIGPPLSDLPSLGFSDPEPDRDRDREPHPPSPSASRSGGSSGDDDGFDMLDELNSSRRSPSDGVDEMRLSYPDPMVAAFEEGERGGEEGVKEEEAEEELEGGYSMLRELDVVGTGSAEAKGIAKVKVKGKGNGTAGASGDGAWEKTREWVRSTSVTEVDGKENIRAAGEGAVAEKNALGLVVTSVGGKEEGERESERHGTITPRSTPVPPRRLPLLFLGDADSSQILERLICVKSRLLTLFPHTEIDAQLVPSMYSVINPPLVRGAGGQHLLVVRLVEWGTPPADVVPHFTRAGQKIKVLSIVFEPHYTSFTRLEEFNSLYSSYLTKSTDSSSSTVVLSHPLSTKTPKLDAPSSQPRPRSSSNSQTRSTLNIGETHNTSLTLAEFLGSEFEQELVAALEEMITVGIPESVKDEKTSSQTNTPRPNVSDFSSYFSRNPIPIYHRSLVVPHFSIRAILWFCLFPVVVLLLSISLATITVNRVPTTSPSPPPPPPASPSVVPSSPIDDSRVEDSRTSRALVIVHNSGKNLSLFVRKFANEVVVPEVERIVDRISSSVTSSTSAATGTGTVVSVTSSVTSSATSTTTKRHFYHPNTATPSPQPSSIPSSHCPPSSDSKPSCIQCCILTPLSQIRHRLHLLLDDSWTSHQPFLRRASRNAKLLRKLTKVKVAAFIERGREELKRGNVGVVEEIKWRLMGAVGGARRVKKGGVGVIWEAIGKVRRRTREEKLERKARREKRKEEWRVKRSERRRNRKDSPSFSF